MYIKKCSHVAHGLKTRMLRLFPCRREALREEQGWRADWLSKPMPDQLAVAKPYHEWKAWKASGAGCVT